MASGAEAAKVESKECGRGQRSEGAVAWGEGTEPCCYMYGTLFSKKVIFSLRNWWIEIDRSTKHLAAIKPKYFCQGGGRQQGGICRAIWQQQMWVQHELYWEVSPSVPFRASLMLPICVVHGIPIIYPFKNTFWMFESKIFLGEPAQMRML